MILLDLAITDEFHKTSNYDFFLANLIDEFYSVKGYLYQSITYIRMVKRSLRNLKIQECVKRRKENFHEIYRVKHISTFC